LLADLATECGGDVPPKCSHVLPGFPETWERYGTVLSGNYE
jgi:hypothetical protein